MTGRRTHDPERDAALYVSGELRRRDRARFEAHLLECEDCWREVWLDRAGKRLAEASREIAPPGLRDDVRAAVGLSPNGSRARIWPALVAVAIVMALGVSGLFVASIRRQPAPIASAISMFHAGTLSASGPATKQAPDLKTVGLQLVSSGRVDLGGVSADGFAYRDPTGERVLLFLSGRSFPEARGAVRHGSGQGWHAQVDGLTLVCGDRPTSYLLIAGDPSLVGPAERSVTSSVISS
jgi:hypothetical protein